MDMEACIVCSHLHATTSGETADPLDSSRPSSCTRRWSSFAATSREHDWFLQSFISGDATSW